MNLLFTVNGKEQTLENISPLRRLLDVLRDDLGLYGSKEGCGEGECGACSVLMDGQVVNSCLIPAAQVQGAVIETVEGTASSSSGKVIVQAFAEAHSTQCGFCTPGITVVTQALLQENPQPDEGAVRRALAGNICRCTGYDMVVEGVELAAKRLKRGES